MVRVDSDQALEEAIKHVARKSRFMLARYFGCGDGGSASQVLVQAYVPGKEIAVDGYVRHGQSHILSVIDKPDVSAGPYFEDRAHIAPSRLDGDPIRKLEILVQATVQAVGLDDSPFHLEARIDGDQMHILEIGARTGLIQNLRRSRGIDQVAVAIALKLGESPPVKPRWKRYAGSLCLSADRHGSFVALHNIGELLRDPRITGVRVLTQPGQRVAPPPDTTGYVGLVSVTADSYPDAERAIDHARATLRLEIR